MGGELHDGVVAFRPLSPGREQVMLGRIPVGEIGPVHDPRSLYPVCFRISLPYASSSAWIPARDIEDARRQSLDKINDWLHAAGVTPSSSPASTYSNVNKCPSCKRMFVDGETCLRGGCPMGGDF